MSGIGAVSGTQTINALRIINPAHQSRDTGADQRGSHSASRTTYAAQGAHPAHQASASGNHAPFVAQALANDNSASATPGQGAIAYLITQHCLTDLPTGFLISRSA